jgi:L-ascorbate metabolism protein UlaG (beta-lactamase superfamily)
MLEGFTWFKQSAYLWRGEGLAVYIDPWEVTTDDPADVIFITHAHFDHFQPEEIEKLRTPKTRILAPTNVASELPGNVTPVRPGDSLEAAGIKVQVVPAYNIKEGRLEMHPKANAWVGYVLELGSNSYYHAGDTDHLPELAGIRTDVAFLPSGGTYTMDAAEAGGLAKAIGPQVAVPMHYGFVVGQSSDAELFARESDPVKVQTLTPVHAFERP